jgi:hypothetical protein
LPDLARRVAVRTVAFAIAMALVIPLSARSATPIAPETRRLLAAASEPLSLLDRGPAGREVSAALSLQEIGPSIGVETLQLPVIPTPGVVAPEASFGTAPTAAPVAPAPLVVAPPVTGSTITGKATWYCCTSGWRGVAVVALPGPLGGRYDPPPASRSVTVCADRCASLPVVDYCDCYWGTSDQRVADLSPEAWAAVSDADRSFVGVIPVTVHLGS